MCISVVFCFLFTFSGAHLYFHFVFHFLKMRFLSPFCLRFHFIYSSFLSSNEQFRHNELRNYGVTKDFMGLYSSERTSFSCNGKERKTGIIVLFSRLLFYIFFGFCFKIALIFSVVAISSLYSRGLLL